MMFKETGKERAEERLIAALMEQVKALEVKEPCLLIFETDANVSDETMFRLGRALKEVFKTLKLKKTMCIALPEGVNGIKTMGLEAIQEAIDSLEEAKIQLGE